MIAPGGGSHRTGRARGRARARRRAAPGVGSGRSRRSRGRARTRSGCRCRGSSAAARRSATTRRPARAGRGARRARPCGRPARRPRRGSRGRRARSRPARSAAARASGGASCVQALPVVDTAVQQQQLRDAMAAAHQIAAHLLTRAREMPRRLERRRRHRHRLQLPGQQQPREQLRVLAVGLDPVARRPRRLRRRDHLDRIPAASAAR